MQNATSSELMIAAWKAGVVVPAFNIPYLPVMEPVVRALRDANCFGLIAVARPEWMKFGAGSIGAIREEYERVKDERFTRLHLDHVPVIDEDGLPVDYEAIFAEALMLGYESVMVDGSRLGLEENIAATRKVVDMAHAKGAPVEAELGAVLGHESGPMPPYEELFATGKGFTDVGQATRFVQETEVDWLSVAIGSIHGAISEAKRHEKKVEAKLKIDHLEALRQATNVPLVLHGGSGVRKEYMQQAFKHGIAKINVGTTVRQAYEAKMDASVDTAQQAVYDITLKIIREELEVEGSAAVAAKGLIASD